MGLTNCTQAGLAFALLVATILIPQAEAHQLFNSEEEKIAGYKIAIATDPEIPGPGSPSRLLVAITDYDGNDLVDVRAGLKIFKDDVLIRGVEPGIHPNGHFELEYAFPESGLYIVQVTIINPLGKEISSKFNVGIIQTFGYIFFAMVVIGALMPPTIIGVILIRRRQAKKINRRSEPSPGL